MGIDLSVEMITIALDCKAELELSCTFIDEEFWNFHTYGRMQEIHNATIPATVNVLFEDDNGNFIFDIENIDVNISDIKLNQYTLKGGIRARIDDPNRYWNDRDPVNNPCPD